MRSEIAIPRAAPEALLLALLSPEGRIAAFGGPAGREVRVVALEGLASLSLEGTPWPGRTSLAFSSDGAGGASIVIEAGEGGDAAALDLEQLGGRLSMLAGGAFALDVACRALTAEAYAAWLDPRANRAFDGVEAEAVVEEGEPADPQRPKPGRAFHWRRLDHGALDAEEMEAGLFVEVEEGRRLGFQWETEPGTFVEVRFQPVAALRTPATTPAHPERGPAERRDESKEPRTLVSLTHTGFSRHALAAACARAGRWLERLERLCEYVDGTARVEEEALVARAALEAAVAETPAPEGTAVEVVDRRDPDRVALRVVSVGVLAGSDRPSAHEDALGLARFHLTRLLARAAGAPLHADDCPEGRVGPRGYVEEADVGVPPEIVFRALQDPAARARWHGPLESPARPLGAAAPRALLLARRVDPEGALTLVRLEVSRLEGEPRTRLRLSHAGFPDDARGRAALRRERLSWAFRLLALRAHLEKGLDLATLSTTRKLHPESVEAEVTVEAPPAQVMAEVLSNTKARGEMLLGGVDVEAGTAVAVRRLERSEEVLLVRYRVLREGAGARLRVVLRGFSPEEDFWSPDDRFRLLTGMALDRATERDRIERWAIDLDDALGGEGVVRREVHADASQEEAWAALAEGRRLASWQDEAGAAASVEPWPAGRYAWAEVGGAPAWSGTIVEVDPGRRMIASVSELPRPTLFEVTVAPGDRRRTRILVRHTGFAGAMELRDDAAVAWDARLAALVPWLEGRLERSADAPASLERVWAAFTREEEVRAFVDRDARVALEAAEGDGDGGAAAGAGDAAPSERRVFHLELERGLGPARCAALIEEPPRRLVLEWPCARGRDAALPPARLHVLLEEAEGDPGATRVTLRVTDVPEGLERAGIFRAERVRLRALLDALLAHLARHPSPIGEPPRAAPAGARRLEAAVHLATTAPAAAFAAVTARLAGVYGAPADEAAPARLLYRVQPEPGEPPGETLLAITVEAAGEGGARVSVVEEGFGDGPAWDARLATEERGWAGFLADLRRRDAEGGIAAPSSAAPPAPDDAAGPPGAAPP